MPAYLLDKSVARRTLEGLARVRRSQPLYPEQVVCLTLLYPFINNFHTHKTALNRRLRAMTQQLPVPFRHASLPELWQPTKALAELS